MRLFEKLRKSAYLYNVASLKFGATPQTISRWLKVYREGGLSALGKSKRRGKATSMGHRKRIADLSVSWRDFRKKTKTLK